MPKAKSGNFTLRTIVKACPAEKAAHRFLALQRSGGYSELRMIQRGKAKIDIVGYKWPDKGVRRKLGIGNARKNPRTVFFTWESTKPLDRAWLVTMDALYYPGTLLEISHKTKTAHTLFKFSPDNVQRIARLYKGQPDAKVVELFSQDFLTWYAGIKPHLVTEPLDNPTDDYDRRKQIAETIWKQISTSVKMLVGAHSAGILAEDQTRNSPGGLQFSFGGRPVKILQIRLTADDLYDLELWHRRNRPHPAVLQKKISGAFAEDLDGLIADLYTGKNTNPTDRWLTEFKKQVRTRLPLFRGRQSFVKINEAVVEGLRVEGLSPKDAAAKYVELGYNARGTTWKNPNQKGATTPNQVLFGANGKTKVGWINRETPTRYEITYKEGAQTRTVWRDKNKVKFQRTGKVKRLPNNCPKAANPKDVDILAASEMFHQRAPRFKPFKEDFDWPTKMPLIGPCTQIEYVSDKFDGKVRKYYHHFKKGTRVYFDTKHQKNGECLLIIRGPFEIKPEGITG